MPARVVFDTNVLVSAVIWKGSPYHCLTVARAGLVQPITCDQILSELAEILREKFAFPVPRLQAIEMELRSFMELVDVPGELHIVDADPDDDVIVECAVVGAATWIVSGDRHLLALGSYAGIEAISPAELLARL